MINENDGSFGSGSFWNVWREHHTWFIKHKGMPEQGKMMEVFEVAWDIEGKDRLIDRLVPPKIFLADSRSLWTHLPTLAILFILFIIIL